MWKHALVMPWWTPFLTTCHPERSDCFAKRSSHGVEGSLVPQIHSWLRRAFASPPAAQRTLPASHFVFLMDRSALRARILDAPERRSERHSNRDSDGQPNRKVSSQNSGGRAQR